MDLNKLPKGWEDINIEQYVNYLKTNNSTLDEFEKIMIRLSILTGATYEEVKNLQIKDISKVTRALEWVDKVELPRELKDTFTIENVKYKLCLNATELTGGQYASVMTKLKDVDAFEMLHEILASISLPVGINIKDIEPSYYAHTSELFAKNLSIADAYPIGVFFCEVSKNLTEGIQDYLAQELKKTKEKQSQIVQDFISNGDGSQLLTTWLTEMEQNGTITQT